MSQENQLKLQQSASLLSEVPISAYPLAKFEPLVGSRSLQNLKSAAEMIKRDHLHGTVWNINSTAVGGGVAEMLQTILGYALDLGIDVRWLVIGGDHPFYAITKRIHNGLHGSAGDGGLLGKDEHEHYRRVASWNLAQLASRLGGRDLVILHDPQTAGMIPELKRRGLVVIWRCHIGHDQPNEFVNRSWSFLRPYLEAADAWCFTRRTYAPAWLPSERIYTIAPSIDPFSAKNQDMPLEIAQGIVAHLGMVQAGSASSRCLRFQRKNGTSGVVRRHADIMHSGPLPDLTQPLIVQVSRWDRLKDMEGVMRGFADSVPDSLGVHLALVGPNVHGVSDDPEGAAVYEHCLQTWRELPHFKRSRVQLVCLPMHDVEENAAMVNAIQRHAKLVVQKSLYEGFGLTVTEAMWKGKAVIASGLGGIQDQIIDKTTGYLVKDPTNLAAFGEAIVSLLGDKQECQRLGHAAHRAVVNNFLAPNHLLQYANMIRAVKTWRAASS